MHWGLGAAAIAGIGGGWDRRGRCCGALLTFAMCCQRRMSSVVPIHAEVTAFKADAIDYMALEMAEHHCNTISSSLARVVECATRNNAVFVDPEILVSFLIPGIRLYIATSLCNNFTVAEWYLAITGVALSFTTLLKDSKTLPDCLFVLPLWQQFSVQLRHTLNIYVEVALWTKLPRETVAKIVFEAAEMEIEMERKKMRERVEEERKVQLAMVPNPFVV